MRRFPLLTAGSFCLVDICECQLAYRDTANEAYSGGGGANEIKVEMSLDHTLIKTILFIVLKAPQRTVIAGWAYPMSTVPTIVGS